MYKIMIYINTYSGDKWFYYQENEKDYVAHSLHEIKETVLTLIDTYGKDNIKIVKQVTGEDMKEVLKLLFMTALITTKN